MQQEDLKNLAELFEKAGEGEDDAGTWSDRFQEFVKKELAESAERLKSEEGEVGKRAEGLRARNALFSIVEERLNARCSKLDPGLEKAMKALQEAQATLFKEAVNAVRASAETTVSKSVAASPAPTTPTVDGVMNNSSSCPESPDITLHLGDESSQDEQETTSPDVTERSPRNTPKKSRFSVTSSRSRISEKHSNSYAKIHKKKAHMQANGGSTDLYSDRMNLGRELSLQQLMSIIQSVYASKIEQDKQDGPFNVQPMELHFYGYLEMRYGLSYVKAWADATFKAIEKYNNKECRVAVFGRIMQNKLAEDFPKVLDTLNQTLLEHARRCLQDRFETRTPAEIESLMQNAQQGRDHCGIRLSDCKLIMPDVYNQHDAAEVIGRLERFLETSGRMADKMLPPDCLKLKDFCHIVSNYQMELTQLYLGDFPELFKEVARGTHGRSSHTTGGVLEHEQLKELVRRLSHVQGMPHAQISQLLEVREKATAQALQLPRATFSQCVEYFSDLIYERYKAKSHFEYMQDHA